MQGDQDWFKARLGKVTGSRIKDVLSKGRGKNPSVTRQNYLYQIIAERLMETPKEEVRARSLKWGNDVEPYAREAYEIKNGVLVEQVDFVDHGALDWVGCSPDGNVEDGGIEIKCPIDPAVHIATVINGMPEDHKPQVQFNMWVCKWNWCDFISFQPLVDERVRLYVERITPDLEFVANMKKELSVFLQEVDMYYQQLTKGE